MGTCRLFISQEALDRWVSEGRGVIEGEELTDKQNAQKFRLITGVRFMSEVTGLADAHNLVGTVKDVEQLAALEAEHMHDSVILGDNAYNVSEGFIGTPLVAEAKDQPKPKPRAATIASLQAFFLNNVK